MDNQSEAAYEDAGVKPGFAETGEGDASIDQEPSPIPLEYHDPDFRAYCWVRMLETVPWNHGEETSADRRSRAAVEREDSLRVERARRGLPPRVGNDYLYSRRT